MKIKLLEIEICKYYNNKLLQKISKAMNILNHIKNKYLI